MWWRDQWWSLLRVSLAHDMPIPGPDQSPIGGTLVPAELSVELAGVPILVVNGTVIDLSADDLTGRLQAAIDAAQN